ncbi:MAG: DUF2784 domain-containing protein [Desulforhopalus sp.]
MPLIYMNISMIYRLAADGILVLHLLFVAFVIFGLLLIFIGKTRRWTWVRNPWLRIAHLAAICVVTLQSWLGLICPLTIWENALRARAGGGVYAGSFVSHLLETLLYYQAPSWVFTVSYTAFGIVVIASWFVVRPRRFR